MSRLVDWQIRNLCAASSDEGKMKNNWYVDEDGLTLPMIEPFSESVRGGVISYGLTHAGYDLRLGMDFVLFNEPLTSSYSEAVVIDPKRFGDEEYEKQVVKRFSQSHPVVIPPNSYVLGVSLEYLRIPNWVVGECTGKSTLARAGILINTTPLEPGWHGHLCIEIGNCTKLPAVIYPGEGIAQLKLDALYAVPRSTYANKKGVYQGQKGVTLPKVS